MNPWEEIERMLDNLEMLQYVILLLSILNLGVAVARLFV